MINANMRLYNYYTIGTKNSYGQLLPPKDDAEPVGQIKMAINLSNTTIQDNINYKSCEYVALTLDANVKDTFVIDYEGQRLKVLYVNPQGKYKQVFLKAI